MEKMSWENVPVLVTGANGFIGSHVAKGLLEKGAHVITIVRDIKQLGNIDLLGIKDKITILHGDIVDYADCERTLNEYDIEFCFHIAAQAIVGQANRSPLSTFESNIKGTWNILEACRMHKPIKGIIVASSDKAYGQQEKLPYTEDSPLNGYFPYDASKACAEIIAKSYFMTYNLPLAITRKANIYGPADMNMSRIVPHVITRVLKNEPPIIRSDGTPQRDYMYVKDAVSAYLTLAENLSRQDVVGQAFNFGTGNPVSIMELCTKIIKIMGKDIRPQIMNNTKNEIAIQYLDAQKAERVLGWKPAFSIDDGLKETVEWYANNFKI